MLNRCYSYTGREWDKETGLYYYRARYYDPMEGRFITKDPIGFKGGINLYNYVESNPINNTDPFGESSFKDLYCDKLSGPIGACLDWAAIVSSVTGPGSTLATGLSIVNTGATLYVCSKSKLTLANAVTSLVSAATLKFKVFNILITAVDAGVSLANTDMR